MRNQVKKNAPVIIVGAGLSGLRAASLLTAHGIECIVLESRDRIGGRVLTLEVLDNPELGKFDLGPTWFWPRSEKIITQLTKELGLETFNQFNEGRMLLERSQHETPQQHLLPEGAMEPSLRFVGGVQSLIEALSATLPSGAIQLNTCVTSIHQEEDGTISLEANGKKFYTTAVIIAIPPRLVEKNIKFEPELPYELKSFLIDKPTWMAGQAKVIAIYDRPFWREAGLSGFASSWVGPLQEIHDASPGTGTGALFGFFGLQAKKRKILGEDKLMQLVLEQLARLYGPAAENVNTLLFKDWSSDTDTAVEEDAEPLRDYPNYGPVYGDPWGEGIFFTGTETADQQGGHLEGAIQSADRIIARFLKRFDEA
ncbi:flavin monoamine oxidase family protein [Paenibacillus polymyxa]|uniref:flavin monoamine oxidase family protein n=1 Tax=Paenibacillus polymyxa TaxID=1406 RepID=UPI003B5C55C9